MGTFARHAKKVSKLAKDTISKVRPYVKQNELSLVGFEEVLWIIFMPEIIRLHTGQKNLRKRVNTYLAPP